ncbi:MAG: TraR/DksA C4-type zinc finger protein [Bacteroidetes bacterium]|nr:TraR/DksA C4-type zinc finger protein [Bacteroidota bacterium]
MAIKKKPAAKKAAKPAPKPAAKKSGKPAAKKTVAKKPAPAAKKVTKPAPKAVAKKPAKVVHKPAAKPIVKAKVIAKPAPKPTPKPAAKPVPKPEPAKVVNTQKPEAAKPAAKKHGGVDPKSLVSIKPKVQPVVKKEPVKAEKIVIPPIKTTSSVKYDPDFTKSLLDKSEPLVEAAKPIVRYSDSELAEFRELIQRKLDSAKKELAYLQGLITRKDEGGDMDEGRYMTMEDGSVSMEREQLSQMASRQLTFIDHLEKALMRIENKTYGICRVSGKLIDKARLRAVPHATLSIEAKQSMNK